jgi:hypothetical protein
VGRSFTLKLSFNPTTFQGEANACHRVATGRSVERYPVVIPVRGFLTIGISVAFNAQ